MIHFLPDWITGKICADLVNHCNSNSLTPAIRHRRFCPDRIEPAGGDPRCRVPVRPHNQTCPLWNWHTGSMTRRSETLDSGVPTGWIEIDPGDAKAPGIKDKKKICVAIRRGLVDAPARVTPYIMKGARSCRSTSPGLRQTYWRTTLSIPGRCEELLPDGDPACALLPCHRDRERQRILIPGSDRSPDRCPGGYTRYHTTLPEGPGEVIHTYSSKKHELITTVKYHIPPY